MRVLKGSSDMAHSDFFASFASFLYEVFLFELSIAFKTALAKAKEKAWSVMPLKKLKLKRKRKRKLGVLYQV